MNAVYPDFDPTPALDDRIEYEGRSLRVRILDRGRVAIVTAIPDAAKLVPIGRELCPWVRSRYAVQQVLIEYGLGDERNIEYAMFDADGVVCGYARCDVLDVVSPGTGP